jgi:DNA-binding winged helix-turn-helix (wHTH) protein
MNPISRATTEPTHLRFAAFELDVRTYELRKNGRKVPLQDQPARLLTILATRRGELVTRTEIQKALWAEDEFVEFEHGINTAIRKIREALEDSKEQPRLIETLPKKGYRFLAVVEATCPPEPVPAAFPAAEVQTPGALNERDGVTEVGTMTDLTGAEREALFAIPMPKPMARAFFLLIQAGYVAMYIVALYKMEVLQRAIAAAGFPDVWVTLPLVFMMCGIAVRIYLMSSVGWGHPAAGQKFHAIFPFLLVFDAIWAAAPLLATEAIGGLGLALAAIAGLAYLPFAQRTLVRCLYPTREIGFLG